jgi:hypothetical protein
MLGPLAPASLLLVGVALFVATSNGAGLGLGGARQLYAKALRGFFDRDDCHRGGKPCDDSDDGSGISFRFNCDFSNLV